VNPTVPEESPEESAAITEAGDLQTINKPQRKPFVYVNPAVVIEHERQKLIQQKIQALEQARSYTLQNKNPLRLKYAIGKGNNSNMIRKCMLLRNERWEETNSFDKLYNFKWQPISRGIAFDQINNFGTRQLINHVQEHPQLTTKDRLFENLVMLCEQRKIDVFKIVPITFMIQFDSAQSSFELEKFITYFNTI
jgi:hypothetical protein